MKHLVTEPESHVSACEFCRKDYAKTCTFCGVTAKEVHHDSHYIGGRGYVSVDFCHDGAACARRQAVPA